MDNLGTHYSYSKKILILLGAVLLGFSSITQAAINIGDGTINVDVGSNSNTPEAAVANALVTICGNRNEALGDALNQLCNALDQVDETDTADVYRALSARVSSALTTLSARGPASITIDDFAKRLAALRRGSRNVSLARFKVQDNDQSVVLSEGLQTLLNANGGAASADQNNTGRLSGFISGAIAKSEQDETSTLAGFDGDSNSLTLGLDYRLSDKAFAGVATRYLDGELDLDGGLGDLDASDINLTFYGTYYPSQDYYFDAIVYYSQSEFDINRRVDFSLASTPPLNISEVATSSTDGDRYGLSLGGGYEQYFKDLGVTMLLNSALQFSRMEIDAYSERDGGGYGLSISEQSIDALTLRAGAQFSYTISMASGVIMPAFSFNLRHEFEDEGEKIRARFNEDPDNEEFVFTTDTRDSDYYDIALGATMVMPGGFSGFVQYEATLGVDDFEQSLFSLGARMEF